MSEDVTALHAAARALRLDLDARIAHGLPADDAAFVVGYQQASAQLHAIEMATSLPRPDAHVRILAAFDGLADLLPLSPLANDFMEAMGRVLEQPDE